MSFVIYMIRNGLFGQDYGMKLTLALIGLGVCLCFIIFAKKIDYFYVFVTGSIIWSIFELMITILGIRSSVDASILGVDLHWALAGIIRGASEGAVVAIVGIIFGDYIPSRKHRKYALPAAILTLTFFVSRTLINRLPVKNIGGDVLSRRGVFAWPSILFFLFFAAIVTIWYLSQEDSRIRTRAKYMFITTFVFSSIWSIAQYIANTRWIETMRNSTYVQAPPVVEFLVFAWDVIFEISLCYVAFLVIPQLLNLIKSPQELSSVRERD